MEKLNIPFGTWKQIVEVNDLPLYHQTIQVDMVSVWCGNADMIYRSEVDAENFSDWDSYYCGSSTSVESEDDAVARIVGLSVVPPTPKEPDGRMNIVNAPMTHGMSTWWTGSGDNLSPTPPSSGRGQGQAMNFNFTEPDDKTITLDFSSYIEIYDGEGVWGPTGNWSIFDRFWIGCYIRKNSDICVENVDGQGNCNVVNTGQGFSIVVPAPGDTGAYDIDLAKARPAPAGDGSQINYWRLNEYYTEGDPEPAFNESWGPGGNHAIFYDLAFSIPFCNDMPMGSVIGRFEVDSDKTEPIHKNWQVKLRCKRVSDGYGEFGVWLKFFRPDTVEYVFGT